VSGFDTYVAVDWSAAATPTTGRNSIWVAWTTADGWRPRLPVPWADNPPTRFIATEQLRALLRAVVADGRRAVVGFDFPLGYPRGTADAFALTGDGRPWERLWAALDERLVDTRLNGNDRFEVAAGLNGAVAGDGPFWGCTPTYRRAQEVAGESLLSARRTVAPYGDGRPAEWRIVEAELRAVGWRPSPVWQLVGAGAVGSQSLTGIPRVRALRHDPELAPVSRVWPFETGADGVTGDGPLVVHAEIWPRLLEEHVNARTEEPADRAEVLAVVAWMRHEDGLGRLVPRVGGAHDLPATDREAVLTEEGWVLGVG
jgi:precorrin-8X/cobalt-precorrin-8 methylmutase